MRLCLYSRNLMPLITCNVCSAECFSILCRLALQLPTRQTTLASPSFDKNLTLQERHASDGVTPSAFFTQPPRLMHHPSAPLSSLPQEGSRNSSLSPLASAQPPHRPASSGLQGISSSLSALPLEQPAAHSLSALAQPADTDLAESPWVNSDAHFSGAAVPPGQPAARSVSALTQPAETGLAEPTWVTCKAHSSATAVQVGQPAAHSLPALTQPAETDLADSPWVNSSVRSSATALPSRQPEAQLNKLFTESLWGSPNAPSTLSASASPITQPARRASSAAPWGSVATTSAAEPATAGACGQSRVEPFASLLHNSSSSNSTWSSQPALPDPSTHLFQAHSVNASLAAAAAAIPAQASLSDFQSLLQNKSSSSRDTPLNKFGFFQEQSNGFSTASAAAAIPEQADLNGFGSWLQTGSSSLNPSASPADDFLDDLLCGDLDPLEVRFLFASASQVSLAAFRAFFGLG